MIKISLVQPYQLITDYFFLFVVGINDLWFCVVISIQRSLFVTKSLCNQTFKLIFSTYFSKKMKLIFLLSLLLVSVNANDIQRALDNDLDPPSLEMVNLINSLNLTWKVS